MRLWAVAAGLASLLAAPAWAQQEDRPPTPAERAAWALIQQAQAAASAGDLAAEAKALDAALGGLPERALPRGRLQCWRAIRLFDTQPAKAREALAECRDLAADDPQGQALAANVLLRDEQVEPAARLLVAAMQRNPGGFAGCGTGDVDEVRTLLRKLEYAGLPQLRADFVDTLATTSCGNGDPAFLSGLMREAILTRLAGGAIDRARASLAAVVDPQDMLQMLVDRRYAAIWPDIDRAAAGTLEPQRAALLYQLRTRHAAEPSLESIRKLAYALDVTGHRSEAIRILRAAIVNPALPDPERYARATMATRLGNLLNAAGETRVAVVTAALRDLLQELPGPGKDGLWNAVPNLAIWLINYGEPGEALAALERSDSDRAPLDAPAANGYFVALKACARFRKGEARAGPMLASIATDYATNPGAVRIATMCGPDAAAQRAFLLKLMDDPERGGTLLLDLIRLRTLGPGKGVVLSLGDKALVAALADPAFARALDARARDPGPGYHAALGKWDARR